MVRKEADGHDCLRGFHLCRSQVGEISWSSDGASQVKGWSICAGMPTTVSTPAPTPSPKSHILVIEGICEIIGDFVQSPNY